jgi:hypothetical protein
MGSWILWKIWTAGDVPHHLTGRYMPGSVPLASLTQYDEFKAALERIGSTVLEDRAIQLQRGSEEIMLIRFNNRPEIVFAELSAG